MANTIKPQYIKTLEYLHHVGPLTSLKALDELGIISFPKRICQLKQQGIKIDDEFVSVTNRYGELVTVKQYSLNEKDTDMDFVERLERIYDEESSMVQPS